MKAHQQSSLYLGFDFWEYDFIFLGYWDTKTGCLIILVHHRVILLAHDAG
jgi:hypothetical protein